MAERVNRDIGTAAAALDLDTELMVRVKEGDGASFGVLLEKHRSPVVHFLYRMVQNHAVAEELAQEVFLRVYRSRGTYEPTARLDDDSSDMPVRQVSDHRPSVEQRMVYQAKLDEVRRAIAALPEKQRAAVLMHKYEEMEYTQIAKVLSCSESAVKSLLFRAYETLRARLAHMA
jgi:RNA polymerase sigma-70 factor (ECF subfamily)